MQERRRQLEAERLARLEEMQQKKLEQVRGNKQGGTLEKKKLRLVFLEKSSPTAAKFYTPALSVSIGFFFLSMTDLGGQIQTRETRKREGERRSC